MSIFDFVNEPGFLRNVLLSHGFFCIELYHDDEKNILRGTKWT